MGWMLVNLIVQETANSCSEPAVDHVAIYIAVVAIVVAVCLSVDTGMPWTLPSDIVVWVRCISGWCCATWSYSAVVIDESHSL